ncbi:hypothetical protein VitviT2T_015779 [Vitis vinifera]|nr:hypothetical protein VitviT2T_015779 [Vitis vinifera]
MEDPFHIIMDEKPQGQLSGTILFHRPCIRIEPALWLSRSLLQLSYALRKDGLARGVKW